MKFMKTVLIVLSMFCAFTNHAQSDSTYNKQFTYIDALQLTKLYKGKSLADRAEYFEILGKYGITKENILTHPILKTYPFDDNHVEEVNGMIKGDSLGGPQPLPVPPAPKQPQVAPGMNWQAAAINGLATFMAGRFKEEVLHYGLNTIFGEMIYDSTLNNVIDGLFPKTYTQIKLLYLDSTSSYYTADLLYLKQLVQLDLDDLESNFFQNVLTIFPKLKNHPNVTDGITLGVGIVDLIEREVPIDEIISRLSQKAYASDSSAVGKTMNFMDLISMAFRDVQGSSRTWVNPRVTLPINGNPQQKMVSDFFYGLLYKQLHQIPEISGILDSLDSNTIEISYRLHEIGLIVNDLENLVETIKNKADELTNQDVISILSDLIDVVSSTANILDDKFAVAKEKMLEATAIANDVLSIRSYLLAKNYQLAIAEMVSVLGQYSAGSIELSRALSFITGLAAINNDTDMEQLLQAHALPIGGASIKRGSKFNLSINSYVGLTGGFESAYVSTGSAQWKPNIGLSAPIGISTTFAKGRVTAFASFIDLGSIVNQRLNNDTTSYSNLRFEQFFTPGGALLYNFKNAPLSMGVHYCFIPNLRTVKYESGGATIGESGVSVSRINFSILVDIPFFTLYNRPIGSTSMRKIKRAERDKSNATVSSGN